MNEPVFDEIVRKHRFSAFPTEYTDRLTPEVARNEGFMQGYAAGINKALQELGNLAKPTKQVQAIIKTLEEITYE